MIIGDRLKRLLEFKKLSRGDVEKMARVGSADVSALP
jgi:hypothetical protein